MHECAPLGRCERAARSCSTTAAAALRRVRIESRNGYRIAGCIGSTASTITVRFSDRATKFEYPGAFTRKFLKLAES